MSGTPSKPSNGSGNWGGPGGGDRVWKPFTSGNQPSPAAKSAGHAEAKTLREMASSYKKNIIDVWVEIMNDPSQPAAARVLAADKIASRSEGLPTQNTNITVNADPNKLTDEELLAIAQQKFIESTASDE